MNVRKAAEHLIAECNQKGHGWHSVYIQNRVNQHTAEVRQVLMVHVYPGHESKWRNREQHFGFPVEVHPWPEVDMH